MFIMNDSLDVTAVSLAIESIRNGETQYLQMYSDEYIEAFANDEDRAFWFSEKAKFLESKNVA